jgi:hypothetical protein
MEADALMSLPGVIADKLGARYEFRWTLRVLAGHADRIVIERLSRAGEGIRGVSLGLAPTRSGGDRFILPSAATMLLVFGVAARMSLIPGWHAIKLAAGAPRQTHRRHVPAWPGADADCRRGRFCSRGETRPARAYHAVREALLVATRRRL